MSKNHIDPDTRARYKKQDDAHELSQSKYQNELARNSRGDELSALSGLDRSSSDQYKRDALRIYDATKSQMFIYLNTMFQKHRNHILSRVAMDIHKMELDKLTTLQSIQEKHRSYKNTLVDCACLSESELAMIQDMFTKMDDSADDFYLFS